MYLLFGSFSLKETICSYEPQNWFGIWNRSGQLEHMQAKVVIRRFHPAVTMKDRQKGVACKHLYVTRGASHSDLMVYGLFFLYLESKIQSPIAWPQTLVAQCRSLWLAPPQQLFYLHWLHNNVLIGFCNFFTNKAVRSFNCVSFYLTS